MATEGDYWVTSGALESLERPDGPSGLSVSVIEGVFPLDTQIGAFPSKPCPDVLAAQVFGLSGDPSKHAYAILDAGRIPNLEERLEFRDEQHSCLFRGQAGEDLKGIAPWMVSLGPADRLTRSLFTSSGQPGDLWMNDAAIYVRSHKGFSSRFAHFRKFTKLMNDAGNWSFFRFWEPWMLQVLAMRSERLPALSRMMGRIFGGDIVTVLHRQADLAYAISFEDLEVREPIRLTAYLRGDLSRAVFYKGMLGSAKILFENHQEQIARYGARPRDLWPILFDLVDEALRVGLTDPTLRSRMMLLAVLAFPAPWPAFIETREWRSVAASGNVNQAFEDLCSRIKYQNSRNDIGSWVWW